MNPPNETSDNPQEKPDSASQGEALEAKTQNQTTEKPKKKIPLGKILVAGIVILITLFAFGLIAYLMMGQNKSQEITNYEECVAAGNPIMESYPEQCSANGQTFTRTLTEEEQQKLDPTTDWKLYTNNDFGFSLKYPIDWSQDLNNSLTLFGPLATENHIGETVEAFTTPLVTLEVEKVNAGIDIIKYKNISEATNPQWKEYSIGEIVGKEVIHQGCVSGLCREIVFENKGILYTFSEQNELAELDQILSTFKFINQERTERVVIKDDFWFDITILPTYTINVNSTQELEKQVAVIKNESDSVILKIHTNTGGEENRIGKTTIDDVPFYVNYSEDIQCNSNLGATNWILGTKPVFDIFIECTKSEEPNLEEVEQIINSIKFSPNLKNVLIGNVSPTPNL